LKLLYFRRFHIGNQIGASEVKVGFTIELKVNNKVSLSKPQSVPLTAFRIGTFWDPFLEMIF
jgi:hypothetical protein